MNAAPAFRPPWLDRSNFPYSSRFLDLAGARLHYVDEGPAHARPVLFVPGSPTWSYMYRHAIGRLCSRHRCIAVDLPGLGLSTARLDPGLAHRNTAGWLGQLVQTLDLRDATLVIHATAGPAALRMAVRNRERFSGLVISNTFAWPLDVEPRLRFFVRLVSSRMFAFLNVRFNALARITARIGRRTGSFSAAERSAILGPYRSVATRRHLQNYLYGVRVERDFFAEVERELPQLADLSTLLLYGAHDNGYRAGFVDRWRSTLPHHRLRVLPTAGHFPFEDEPEDAVGELAAWLSEGAPSSPPPAPSFSTA